VARRLGPVTDAGSPEPPPEEVPLETRPEVVRRAHRWALLYTAAAVALLPWIAYLAVSLPKRNLEVHYRAAWVGFDCLLVFVIVRTAYMAFRVDPRVTFAATATATLLFVDAWFDITTSNGRSATLLAILLALLVEIPAALFSLHLARRVNRQVLHLAHLDQFTHGGVGPHRRGSGGGAHSDPVG
jgi:hypothetical protein